MTEWWMYVCFAAGVVVGLALAWLEDFLDRHPDWGKSKEEGNHDRS